MMNALPTSTIPLNMVEDNDQQKHLAMVADSSATLDTDQTFIAAEIMMEPPRLQFKNHQDRVAALLPTSQTQAQASPRLHLRISTQTAQAGKHVPSATLTPQIPGAWPKSCTSSEFPTKLDGHEYQGHDSADHYAQVRRPPPFSVTAAQLQSTRDSGMNQETAWHDDIWNDIGEIHRDMRLMRTAQGAIQTQLKQIIDQMYVIAGALTPGSSEESPDGEFAELADADVEDVRVRARAAKAIKEEVDGEDGGEVNAKQEEVDLNWG